MTDLYLIAHKVRGEPAFDIATRMTCPECHGQCDGNYIACNECDSLGYWWIIPTSGHRAYPYGWQPFGEGGLEIAPGFNKPMPDNWPDHYPSRSTPTISLTEALGLNKPKPQAPIVRRI